MSLSMSKSMRKAMAGTLYVVATPIGNLADITMRALSTLREVDLIAAEDTRVTHHLLKHYGIDTPTTPYHQHSLGRKAEKLIQMMNEGKNIALVSDAGTPGVSDPGHEIITAAIAQDIPIVVIPGPSAVITALVASGLPTQRFTFEGFPPRRAGERRAYFTALKDEPRTMVFYEAPHRVESTLADMRTVWGERNIAVVREATKIFEEVLRGTTGDAVERFKQVAPRGEFTIVVEGSSSVKETTSEDQIKESLQDLLNQGMTERDAVKGVMAIHAIPKNEVYRLMVELKRESSDEK